MTALWVRAVLLFPSSIERSLDTITVGGAMPRPTLGQIALGVLRMQYRLLTRPETVGMCTAQPVRANWRARALAARPVRFPFLLRERAIAPLDFSGLASSRERIVRHLLGAHHDGHQFVYDLELLAPHAGALDELRERARAIVDGTDPRSAWLRDLCVYEDYHEHLLAAVDEVIASGSPYALVSQREADDPDITLRAYLRWCAQQPSDVGGALAAWRAGAFDAYEPETTG